MAAGSAPQFISPLKRTLKCPFLSPYNSYPDFFQETWTIPGDRTSIYLQNNQEIIMALTSELLRYDALYVNKLQEHDLITHSLAPGSKA